MRYRNKITGIEFSSSSRISGADFEEVTPKVYTPKAEPKPEPKEPEKKEVKAPKKPLMKRSKK